jgi:succinoglycan biosynthesis transport protein ExoP
LLPAGTPGFDPSRLLQGDQLAGLLSQLRQAFDIIIMDAPPVLLVPDALTVGRWTDGALLAVRYDTSRFPLVERAHRRLTAVGVPLIGAVVNGVRTMESSYGYYSYAYHASRSASTSTTVDVPAEPTA